MCVIHCHVLKKSRRQDSFTERLYIDVDHLLSQTRRMANGLRTGPGYRNEFIMAVYESFTKETAPISYSLVEGRGPQDK